MYHSLYVRVLAEILLSFKPLIPTFISVIAGWTILLATQSLNESSKRVKLFWIEFRMVELAILLVEPVIWELLHVLMILM